MAYGNIGYAYSIGRGVEVDKKKAIYSYELAAIRGDATASYNIGVDEYNMGNMGRAFRHYMIAVGGGDSKSLQAIKQLYMRGQASKDDYTTALQLYQEYMGEIKSKQRDDAAAAREDYRYY
jgi:TPR repeat protein